MVEVGKISIKVDRKWSHVCKSQWKVVKVGKNAFSARQVV